MNIDRYIKFILTYIAICLTALTLKELGFVPNAFAQQRGPTPVAICDVSSRTCADVRSNGSGLDGLVVTLPQR